VAYYRVAYYRVAYYRVAYYWGVHNQTPS
jgi:hypothetical protein